MTYCLSHQRLVRQGEWKAALIPWEFISFLYRGCAFRKVMICPWQWQPWGWRTALVLLRLHSIQCSAPSHQEPGLTVLTQEPALPLVLSSGWEGLESRDVWWQEGWTYLFQIGLQANAFLPAYWFSKGYVQILHFFNGVALCCRWGQLHLELKSVTESSS